MAIVGWVERKRDPTNQYEVFVNSHSLNLRSNETLDNNKKKRITIGRVGVNDAIVDLHLNKDGTTTVNHTLGKNQELGAKLAQFLLETIDPNEFISVNYTLKGIHTDNIEPIVEEISYCSLDGENEFDLLVFNGLANNRFVAIAFNGNSFDRKTFKVLFDVDQDLKQGQDNYFRAHPDLLKASVLSSSELKNF